MAARCGSGQTNPEVWVDAHGDALFRYALVRVRQREVVEDLVQETLLSAMRSREKFAGQSSERSWLFGILKRKISDYFRKLGPREVLHGPGIPCQRIFGEVRAGRLLGACKRAERMATWSR